MKKSLLTILLSLASTIANANTICESSKLGTFELADYHAHGCSITFITKEGMEYFTKKTLDARKPRLNDCKSWSAGQRYIYEAVVAVKPEFGQDIPALKIRTEFRQAKGAAHIDLAGVGKSPYAQDAKDLNCRQGPSTE